MKRLLGAAAVVLVAYLVALAGTAPAGVVWRVAEPRLDLPFALEVATVSGSTWRGRADGIRVDGRDAGALAWRWQPAALLTGRLGLAVDWEGGRDQVTGRLRLRPGELQAQGVRGTLGAQRLQEWFDLPLLLNGQIGVDLPAIAWHFDTGFQEAQGALSWGGAAAGLPRPIPLGEYRAVLGLRDGMLLAEIESAPESPLDIAGAAGWRPDGGYRVDLVLRAAADATPALSGALNTAARPQPDGSHRITLGESAAW
ncbi:type II secretion system protein N [Thioalkalivibrio nitratireducens DSM 14787]|uniref:Type II secretion system protein N n=1 Tax=Thioalkalivibrio nitratireducens (strain DSM 14787 / UNIQEM 213 / ALEN2) TaxID=1255043 RepID=L0E2I3_THIND|nr:type II secretion system protein N [Thioalkalivibrio nitratireducens]AGA35457.1 type II secretion system protein N [Thioalkalivibrio nitratireducens DSM 14787]